MISAKGFGKQTEPKRPGRGMKHIRLGKVVEHIRITHESIERESAEW